MFGAPRSRVWLILLPIAAILIVLGVLAATRGLYEVIDQGTGLTPYAAPDDVVYETRFFDAVTVFSSEESRLRPDVPTGMLLFSIAVVAACALALFRRLGASSARIGAFYAATALGAAYLAVDELFGLHETIGYNLGFLADLPGVDHPDDVVFASYVIPTIAYVAFFRDVLLEHRAAVILLAAAFLLQLTATFSDVVVSLPSLLEDSIELVATACGLGAILVIVSRQLHAVLARSSAAALP